MKIQLKTINMDIRKISKLGSAQNEENNPK